MTFFSKQHAVNVLNNKSFEEEDRHRRSFMWLGYDSGEAKAFLALQPAVRQKVLEEMIVVANERHNEPFRNIHFQAGYRRDRTIKFLGTYSDFAREQIMKTTRSSAINRRVSELSPKTH